MARRRRKKSEALPVADAILSALSQAGMKNMARRFQITQIYEETVGKVVFATDHRLKANCILLILSY